MPVTDGIERVSFSIKELIRHLDEKFDVLAAGVRADIGGVRQEVNGVGARLANVEFALPELKALGQRMEDGARTTSAVAHRLDLHEREPGHPRTVMMLDQIEQRLDKLESNAAQDDAVHRALAANAEALSSARRAVMGLIISVGALAASVVAFAAKFFGVS